MTSEEEARRVAEAARAGGRTRPGFARELFLGRLRLDLLQPGPEPTVGARAEGERFLARLTEFVTTRLDPAAIERAARVPDEVVNELRALGAFGMRIAPEYGGLGLDHVTYGRALALLGTASPALGALLSAHQSIGVPQPLALFGTEEQRRAYLPRCAAGAVSAFLLTEPDVGSDPARLGATATPDGDDYLLDGTKLWTTNGPIAELLVVLARVPETPGHVGGITAFVVEADAPGVTVEARNTFMGLRGIENGVTRLHRVRVPAGQRIGEEGAGLRIALSTLDTGRLALPAMCVGACRWSLRIAREWSAERVQWGRPIGQHEAVAGKLAFVAATTFALEAVVELAGELADEARTDIRVEAALAKLFGSEMTWRIVDDLVQIRGGRGFETADSLTARGERGVPVEQLLRDTRINRIFEGSSEIMRLLIAREAVDAHLRVAGDLVAPEANHNRKRRAAVAAGGFYVRWLPTLATGRGQLPLSYGDFRISGHPDLSLHLRYVERTARRLARSVFYGMTRWQGRLQQRQGFLGRVVDIGAELFASTAACVHAERLRARGESGLEAYQLADAFCRQAHQRIEELFPRLWHNTDGVDGRLATAVLEGRHTWLEAGVEDHSAPGPWVAETGQGPSPHPNLHRPVPRA
ncbi:acyl-CoA dehydrogenase family protein [Streptomyces sp. DSM 44915]|uniref:Acyl-CoA dehydrogenase family protein n=1 Tax=Streptomyces chisholmiae TaxID=3075540 RepID=A0ABU2JWB5_9ACTN|nr:acyl-CoA dehydrogenase family protein [Streptomyces sp. DSM 44915]MDT0269298.1 acyl-CoA dehydrogenase family protein [Streptomyces sp. DSM 44915]